jgi:hypothetical protein
MIIKSSNPPVSTRANINSRSNQIESGEIPSIVGSLLRIRHAATPKHKRTNKINHN